MNRWTLLLTVLLMLAQTGVTLACPNCKDSIANTAANGVSTGLPAGFNISIYFMLAGLFCVLGFFGFAVVKTIRATDAQSARRGFPVK